MWRRFYGEKSARDRDHTEACCFLFWVLRCHFPVFPKGLCLVCSSLEKNIIAFICSFLQRTLWSSAHVLCALLDLRIYEWTTRTYFLPLRSVPSREGHRDTSNVKWRKSDVWHNKTEWRPDAGHQERPQGRSAAPKLRAGGIRQIRWAWWGEGWQ